MNASRLVRFSTGLCVLLAGASVLLAQGSLTPPGAPVPLFKTLEQIEPRKPISSLPYTIGSPGSYYFTSNLFFAVTSCTGGTNSNAIQILSDNVTLDLKGFTLTVLSNANIGCSQAILAPSGVRNVIIRNGIVQRSFQGVNLANATNCQIENLVVNDCGASAIQVGDDSTVMNCNVKSNGTFGISVGQNCLVKNCVVASCGNAGIRSTGSGCTIASCTVRQTTQEGFNLSDRNTVLDCTSTGNGLRGFLLGMNCSVSRCTGSLNSGAGFSGGQGCTFIGCVATDNGTYGITASSYDVTIRECDASGNSSDGILVANRSHVIGNTCNSNFGSGVHATGTGNRIEGNNANDNYGGGIGYGIRIDGTANLVIKNSAHGNTVGNYTVVAGNNYGVILVNPGAGFTSSAAWANFDY